MNFINTLAADLQPLRLLLLILTGLILVGGLAQILWLLTLKQNKPREFPSSSGASATGDGSSFP